MLERRVWENPLQRTCQRVKWSSRARVMTSSCRRKNDWGEIILSHSCMLWHCPWSSPGMRSSNTKKTRYFLIPRTSFCRGAKVGLISKQDIQASKPGLYTSKYYCPSTIDVVQQIRKLTAKCLHLRSMQFDILAKKCPSDFKPYVSKDSHVKQTFVTNMEAAPS